MSSGDDRPFIPENELYQGRDPGKLSVTLLCGVAIIFLITLIATYSYEIKDTVRPPKVVMDFFTELVSTDYAEHSLEEVLPKYLMPCEDGLFHWGADYPDDWIAFRRTLWNHGQTPTDFEVTMSLRNYIELQFKDANGENLYPKVGFIYQLADDKPIIQDYTLGRLEPFSKYNEEYDDAWIPK